MRLINLLKDKKRVVIKQLYSYFSIVCEMGAGGKKQTK